MTYDPLSEEINSGDITREMVTVFEVTKLPVVTSGQGMGLTLFQVTTLTVATGEGLTLW